MEKLLYMLGMAMIAVVIKVRTAAESVLEIFRGEDGFLMMVGICSVAMICAVMMLSWTSRKRRKAA